MREDIIDQKETKEVATERGKDEKEKNELYSATYFLPL